MKTNFLILIIFLFVNPSQAWPEERGVHMVSDFGRRQTDISPGSDNKSNDSIKMAGNDQNQRFAFLPANRISEQENLPKQRGIKITERPATAKCENETEYGIQKILPVLNRAMKVSLVLETMALLICCVFGVLYKINS